MAHDRPMHPTHAALITLAADKTMSDADILDAIRGLRAIMAKHEAKHQAKREEPEITIEDPEVEPEPGGPACRLDGDRCALGAHCRNIGACTLLFERVAA